MYNYLKHPPKLTLFQQNLVFNSLTSCLGPRKLLHSGKVSKTVCGNVVSDLQ